MANKPTIMIARPCYDGYKYENVASLEHMRNATIKAGYRCGFHFVKGSSIAQQRDEAVQSAMLTKADYILFVDSDMVVLPDVLVRLLERDVKIISALAVTKQPPYNYVVSRVIDGKEVLVEYLPENTLLDDIDRIGFGFVLIKMSVFQSIERPWFKMEPGMGEDYYFSKKAKEAGFKIHLDTGCHVGHIGDYVFTPMDNFAEYDRKIQVATPKIIKASA